MVPSAHRVRRQSWRLEVGSAPAAFATRARFRADVEALLPAFNDVFDAWAPDEAILHIPRLELRLRVASLDELAAALGEALRHEAPRPSPVPRASAAAQGLAVLLHYLETGALAWHAAHAELAAVAARLRATLLAELPAVAMRAPGADASFERALQYFIRLLQILPEARWCEVAAALTSIESRRSVGGSATTPATAGTASAPRGSGEELAAAIVTIVSAHAQLGKHAALSLAAAALATARTKPLSCEDLRAELSRTLGIDALRDAPRAVAQFFGHEIGAKPDAARENSPALERSPPSDARTQTDPMPETSPALTPPLPGANARPAAPRDTSPVHPPPPRPGESAQPRAAPQPFALMAANAGLVLLHPFLPKLFEECGLHDPCRGLEPRSLPRAAALLHWLAAGRDEVHEFELGAIKVLLGQRPDDPLAPGPDLLGSRERDEGAAVLRAAIGHWKALKGTSIDGLRVSFLQRRGALREEETGWRLQLEPESFDVLLGQLPWSIAMVKLPWMTRPLFADWPTP